MRLVCAGVPSVILARFDAEEALRVIDTYKTETTVMVPTHFVRMLALPDAVKAKYDVSSMKLIAHTGAKCPVDVKAAMIDWFGPVFRDAYGATEVGTVCSITSQEWLDHKGSVGRSVSPFSAVILDEAMQELPAGTEGQLFFRDATGRGIVYPNDSAKTASSNPEPGLFTLGEIGYMDADGYVFITDRFSDMVVSGGVNLYPAEAEQLLIDHPGVADVGCVGVPDPEMGEMLIALVIPTDEASPPDPDELSAWLRARLSHYKCPRRYHIVGDLKRNTMGKINKRTLRDAWLAGELVGEISVDDFTSQARAWFENNATPRVAIDATADGRGGSFNVSVFSDMSFEEEQAHILGIADWIQRKSTRGYHAVDWATKHGGLGLSRAHARALGRVEREFETPGRHELTSVTVGLIAPTIHVFGSDELKQRFIAPLLRAEILCCQLFSEPGAGSDLAGLSCRAERDGDEWVINGQKVWSSGAQFSQWGELIARTDPTVAKHKGLTAFMLPLDAPGVDVRPIKQMSGGSSFCEVFFDDVRIPDNLRLGEVGDGWNVATTTLSFERDHSESGAGGSALGGSFRQLLASAHQMGVSDDPVTRDKLVKVYIHSRIESFTNRRAADQARSGTPGPEGSLGKLLWTEGMNLVSNVVGDIIGAHLTADTGEWGTFAWKDHLLGAPGYRIAGGSDEVQRNILGERVLGLPREPRADTGPWTDIPR